MDIKKLQIEVIKSIAKRTIYIEYALIATDNLHDTFWVSFDHSALYRLDKSELWINPEQLKPLNLRIIDHIDLDECEEVDGYIYDLAEDGKHRFTSEHYNLLIDDKYLKFFKFNPLTYADNIKCYLNQHELIIAEGDIVKAMVLGIKERKEEER